jgi:murein DD-endopeptidase MepM/ murein hydrolase activator NlpD
VSRDHRPVVPASAAAPAGKRRGGRRGSPVLLAGLGGFALGAATVLFLVWAYVPAGAPAPAAESSAPPAPPPSRSPAPLASIPGGDATPEPGAAPAPGAPAGEAAPQASAPAAPAAPPGVPRLMGGDDVDELRRRHLLMPVQGVRPEQLHDTFGDARTGHRHEALDIMAPRNSAVLAVEDGSVAKLFVSRQGGNTIYQFDPTSTYAYYYAHLERYADDLREGMPLRRGEVIGYVGTSGNAPPEAPHLHFSILRLNPDKHWWQGAAINPYPVLAQPPP